MGQFVVRGSQVEITELPWRSWTRDYKSFLESLMQEGDIQDLREYHKDNSVRFVFHAAPSVLKLLKKGDNSDFIKKFRLARDISCNNMVLFHNN